MELLFKPEEIEFRRALEGQIFQRRRATNTRGDDLIARYDSAGGERLNRQFELDLSAAIASSFKGTPQELCQRVRHKVPSAKPCRMPAVAAAKPSRWVKGMNSPETRGQLRVGDLSGWGTQKLLGVAAALGAKGVKVELVF